MGDPATGMAWEEPSSGETTSIVLRLHADIVAHGPTDQERSAELWTRSATTVVDLDIFQKYAGKDQTIKIMKKLQSNTMTRRNSHQTTFRVSTPPLISSPMSKQKPQSNALRLQPEFTTFRTETQNTSDPSGWHSLEDPKSFRLTVKSIQELAATSYQPTRLNNYLAMND